MAPSVSSNPSTLFSPLHIGRSTLSNRVVMAPLTRFRAQDDLTPSDLQVEYYSQRASVPGTLLNTDATAISPRGAGYNNAPGIWTDSHVAGWRKVTDAVHAKKSFIYLQMWACGRAADPDVVERLTGDRKWFASSSPVPMKDGGEAPHALTEDEIETITQDYVRAAQRAIEAGFDGVEIHSANGYLLDEFIQDTVNARTDKYGGSIENRSRFPLDVARRVSEAVGADRTALRLSPFSSFQGMRMKDPIPQFSHLITELRKLNLAYLHLIEARMSGSDDAHRSHPELQQETHETPLDPLVKAWGTSAPLLIAGGFQPETALTTIEDRKDYQVAIVFGRHFIANPDLPFRLEKHLPLNKYDRDTFYAKGSPKGYVDYPFSKEWEVESRA